MAAFSTACGGGGGASSTPAAIAQNGAAGSVANGANGSGTGGSAGGGAAGNGASAGSGGVAGGAPAGGSTANTGGGTISGTLSAGVNSGYTYAGCSMFPGTAGGHSGGWYNTDVSTAAPESDSTSLISNYTGGGGVSGGFNMISTTQEVINTPASVAMYAIQSSADNPPETGSMPGPATQYSGSGAPSAGTLLVEGAAGSDGHYHVINTSTCQYWTSGATSWTGSGFRVWNAGMYNLQQPQPLTASYGSVADCCGLPMVAFLIKPAELRGGVINHALGWISPGNEGGASPIDPSRYVSPAVEAQGGASCTTPAPCMPYGAHIRLKASFNDSNFSPGAKAVAEALKHYGAYLMDTGCCLTIGYLAQDWSGIDISAYWTSTDSMYLSSITMSVMDVISPLSSNASN